MEQQSYDTEHEIFFAAKIGGVFAVLAVWPGCLGHVLQPGPRGSCPEVQGYRSVCWPLERLATILHSENMNCDLTFCIA